MKKIILFLSVIAFIACNSSGGGGGAAFDLDGYEVADLKGSAVKHVMKKNEQGKIIEEGFLKNGKKEGQWITYDQTKGAISKIESYVDGSLNGYSFVVSSRGYLDEQAGYLNNVLNGRYFSYRYGRPKSESYYKDGKLNGIQKEFYDNSKLQQETEFKDGIQNGVYKYYSDDGVLRMSYLYKNGEKVEGGIVDVPELNEEEGAPE